MLVTIPQNVFVRRYGEYIYLFNQRNWASALIRMTDCFDLLFDRRTISIDLVAEAISNNTGIAENAVKSDIMNIVEPLIWDGYIVSSEKMKKVNSIPKCEETVVAQNKMASGVHKKDASGLNADKNSTTAEQGTDALMDYLMDNPMPFELCIDLTLKCTARCVHCYVPGFMDVSLPTETVKRVMREFRAMGGLKVKFTGGECMLHKDFVEILEEARADDLVISVLSNLTACGRAEIEAMKECDVAVVQCSLYGADAVTHESVTLRKTFDRTMSAIKGLKDAGIPVRIHCPVMKQNVKGFNKVVALGDRLGIRVSLDASIMSRGDHDSTNQNFCLTDAQLQEFLKKTDEAICSVECDDIIDVESSVCGIGTSKICLAASGEYYPCNGCFGYQLGDCGASLEKVWNDEPIRRLRAIRWKDMKTCTICPNRCYCNVCPARNFNATKNFYKPDPAICRIAKVRRFLAKEKSVC